MDKLTIKQEKFIVNVFSGMNQRESYIDAYNAHYAIETIDANASRLASTEKVLDRLHQLQAEVAERAVNDKVATIDERREVLTEVLRARFIDFVDNEGHLDITGQESLRSAALQELKTTSWRGGRDERATSLTTSIKLRDPLAAIAELNKMDKVYSTEPVAPVTVVSNFLFILSDGTRVSPKELMRVEDVNEQEAEG